MNLKHSNFDITEQVAKLVRSHHPHFENSKLLNSIVMQCGRGEKKRVHISHFCPYHKGLYLYV